MRESTERVWRAALALRRQGWRVEPAGPGRHRLTRQRGAARAIVLSNAELIERAPGQAGPLRQAGPLQLEFAFS